jgi:agmatinase
MPAGQDASKRARVVVLPVPYEGTTCYGAGARFGPEAIIAASKQLEFFNHHTGREDAEEIGFLTLPPLCPDVSGPERMIRAVAVAAAELHRKRKFVLALGGEHSITVGLVRAAASRWRDLCIVQIDAHADLRNSYEGSRFSHACAARRAIEELPRKTSSPQLIQVGIRSLSSECHRYLRSRGRQIVTFMADTIAGNAEGNASWIEQIAALTAGRNVYLSIDLDGLDCSIMPATGTPEPGGLNWWQITALLDRLADSARIISADVVELAPIPGNHAPDFLAAKLAYTTACVALRD